MPIQMTAAAMRGILPRAPQDIIDAFASPEGQAALDKAGITETRIRFSVALSQVEHESGGYTIKNLTENINYSAERAAQIWPSRFRGGANQVRAKYGTARGWQLKMFDDVYGNRMGNRPGTHDGSAFIGHGGPQWTGRDGHEALARVLKDLVPGCANLTAEQAIEYAIDHKMQPQVLAAFWIWKNLNPVCDVGGLRAVTRPWNGGYIGMADREAMMAGNDPVVARMAIAARVMPRAKALPGGPSTKEPPKTVIAAATGKERKLRTAGVATGGAGGAGEAAKTQTGTVQLGQEFLTPVVTYSLIGAGVAAIVVAALLIARKRALIKSNWF